MSKKVKARSLDVESAGRGVWLLKVSTRRILLKVTVYFELDRIPSGHEDTIRDYYYQLERAYIQAKNFTNVHVYCTSGSVSLEMGGIDLFYDH